MTLPPCPPWPGDDLEVRRMPLDSVGLTESGFLSSPEVTGRPEKEAADAVRRADEQATASRTPTATGLDPAAGRSAFRTSPASTAHIGRPSFGLGRYSAPVTTWQRLFGGLAAVLATGGITPRGPQLGRHEASYSRPAELRAPRCERPGTRQEPWVRLAARERCLRAGSAASAGSPRD
jgi:hypothetical protein